MFKDAPKNQQIQFLILSLIYALEGNIYNSMPYLYYLPDMECLINDSWQQCSEETMCSNSYQYRFVNTNDISSVTMEMGLLCEKKIMEASMISMGLSGQVFAFLVAVFYQLPKDKKFKGIAILFIIESLLLISIQFFADSYNVLVFIIFQWNFCYCYLYSQIFTFVNEHYCEEIRQISVVSLNMFWSGGAILYIALTKVSGYWVHHITFFSGYPTLILAILFIVFEGKEKPIDQIQMSSKEHSANAHAISENFISDLVTKVKEIKKNKTIMVNSIIFTLSFSLCDVSYLCPFIAFNRIGGNIQLNVFISIIADFVGSVVAVYLCVKIGTKKLLFWNFIILGVIQSTTFIISYENPTYQMFNVVATKISNRISFPALLTLFPFIIPNEYNQLIFAMANMIAIGTDVVLPFYKYVMELFDLNIFSGVGLITILFSFLLNKMENISTENLDGDDLVEQSMNRRKSSSIRRKQSDAIIEQMIKRSSMISQQIGYFLLDKTEVMDEKKYPYSGNSIHELKTTQAKLLDQLH